MILTGNEIKKELSEGNIIISPFIEKQLNTNSYSYKLGKYLKIYDGFDGERPIFKEVEIPKEGYLLKKGFMYLGSTVEILGSKKYMTSLIGNSDMGRLGLFLQLSANMGHIGTYHNWTLEIYPTRDIIVYSNMIVGKISFWDKMGEAELYKGNYKNFSKPQESLLIK